MFVVFLNGELVRRRQWYFTIVELDTLKVRYFSQLRDNFNTELWFFNLNYDFILSVVSTFIHLMCKGSEKTDFSSKKRQLDGYQDDWKEDGLDLSVKRRKTEDGKEKRSFKQFFSTWN